MKILKLKFKNINSLAGVNEIDFDDPGFADVGIFAITGKTGAGKSSILDAISLALYGKTPRVEITGQTNDVMTRGTSDCFSEVVFEVGGTQWKSSWKQERTRTGNLKPVNRQIADSSDRILADQVRTCDHKIVEILGLTFEQFTKVILLAQGGFAAFLQADKNDKGELLEQITGTEIYGEISRKVFECNKIENQKLEAIHIEMNAIKILPEEEINSLNNEIAECVKQKDQIDTELKSIEDTKKLLVNQEELQKQITEAKTKLFDLEQKVETAKTVSEQVETALKSAKTEQEKAVPILIKVRELDTKIAEKNHVLKSTLDSLEKLGNEINELKKDWEAKNLSSQNMETKFKSNAVLLKSKNEELENQISELLRLLEGMKISDYHAEKERITGFEKEIKNLTDNLKDNIFYQSEIINNEQVVENNLPKIKELSETIKADKVATENLERQIGLLRENIVLLDKIKSLEDHRRSLQDGEECPLCGSTEHPFARGNVPQSGEQENQLLLLELQLKSLNKLISENENDLIKIRSANENAEKNKESAQKKLEENKVKTEQIIAETHKTGYGIPVISESHDGIACLENFRKQVKVRYTKINQKIQATEGLEKTIEKLRDVDIPKIHSEINGNNDVLSTLKTDIATLQTRISEKEEQRNSQNFGKEVLENERNDLAAERYNLLGDKQVDDEEKRLKGLVEKAESMKAEAEKTKTNADTELAKTQAIISEKQRELTEKQAEKVTEKTLKELHCEFDEKKAQSDDLSQKIGAIRQKLNFNDENAKASSEKRKSKERQQEICKRWSSLNELIGSSDGKKYRNFAQALTFEHLIGLTNMQLQKMSDRYILKRASDATNPFELSVIDKFQNCEQRTAQNLSGGEKFIVSLSLALGLANMASKNMKIDTMFIDEGFGTLDSDYLDVALSALSNLHNEGKLIGVISHLTELKERIPTHIEVLPSGNGYSKIECKYDFLTE